MLEDPTASLRMPSENLCLIQKQASRLRQLKGSSKTCQETEYYSGFLVLELLRFQNKRRNVPLQNIHIAEITPTLISSPFCGIPTMTHD